MSMVKYFLGIDGGGTKTEFLLVDSLGNEIKRVVLGASNPVSAGIETTKAVLEEGVKAVCEGVDFAETAVYAGIAGGKAGDNQQIIGSTLQSFGFASVGCGSDIELLLEIALKGGSGTAVIMGTGVVAYAREGENLHRAGGRGYLIDRGGSGFHLGSAALNAAFEYADGRGGSKIIAELTEKILGKSMESAVGEIYGGGAAFIASFAPVVFEAFEKNDPVAKQIIDDNVREAAKIINGARSFLGITEGRIVVCGGLCRQKEILRPFLLQYLNGGFSLEFLEEPLVNGAVSLAKE